MENFQSLESEKKRKNNVLYLKLDGLIQRICSIYSTFAYIVELTKHLYIKILISSLDSTSICATWSLLAKTQIMQEEYTLP